MDPYPLQGWRWVDIDGQQFYVPDSSFVASKDNDVDVFYIHPTGYFLKHWNALFLEVSR